MIVSSCREVIGPQKHQQKGWISAKTLRKIEERKQKKLRQLTTVEQGQQRQRHIKNTQKSIKKWGRTAWQMGRAFSRAFKLGQVHHTHQTSQKLRHMFQLSARNPPKTKSRMLSNYLKMERHQGQMTSQRKHWRLILTPLLRSCIPCLKKSGTRRKYQQHGKKDTS